MKFHPIITTLACAALAFHELHAQALSTRPVILGSAVDPAADIIRVDDVSVSASAGQARQMKVGELVNVPGFFSGLSNGNFLAANSVEFGQVSGLQAALDGKLAADGDAIRTSTKLPPRRSRTDGGLFSALRLALDSSRSVDIAVVGDSLGNASDEYAESFVTYLGTLYPNHRIVKRLITENASASIRNWTETVLRASNGEFYWDFPASRTNVQGVSFLGDDAPIPAGDFEVETKLRVANWENCNGSDIFGWWGGTSPRLTRTVKVAFVDNRRLQIQWYNAAGGFMSLVTGNLGTVAGGVSSTAPADATDWSLRVRFDADNGSGGSTVTFAKSTDNGATWTDMTSLTQGSTTGLWALDSRDAATSTFNIGGQPTLAVVSTRIYDVQIRHGFGTKVLNRQAIDYASMGSTTNLVTTGGSPTIYLHNYSYPGRNTHDLRSDLLGVKPTATVTATGAVTGSGNMTVTVTAAGLAGSPLTLNVAVVNGDTTATWAGKVRAALAGNGAITALFAVTGHLSSIQLEHLNPQANDATLSIALASGTATGITSTSSTITQTGNPRHADRLFGDYGVGIFFFHGGINDQTTFAYSSGGSRLWVAGVNDITTAIRDRNSDLIPVFIATNPKSAGLTQLGHDHQSLRSALMANHARKNNWGFIDVWTSFKEDGRAMTTLVPDGTHPTSTAIAELWNPLITGAYDAEANP
jgi:hypothetical protein